MPTYVCPRCGAPSRPDPTRPSLDDRFAVGKCEGNPPCRGVKQLLRDDVFKAMLEGKKRV